MIQLTPKAEQHFNTFYHLNKGKIFQLSLKKNGCSGYEYLLSLVDLDTQNKNYITFTKEGIPFAINKKFKDFFNGLIIDIQHNKLSSQLQFINPNEKGSCGCGKSISF